MAEVSNSHFIGEKYVRITGWDDLGDRDKQYGILKAYDSALGGAGHAAMHLDPASAVIIDLYKVEPVAASSSADSCRIKPPFPITIWAADVGCEVAAGATGTVDIYTDDGTTDGSILDAAQDVKTAAGVSSRVAPEDGEENVTSTTEIYIKGASGAGGTLQGAQCHIYGQRL